MWQKLNPTGIDTLENTRTHIHKVLQLVCAASRCYLPSSKSDDNATLQWDSENSTFHSYPFGKGKNLQVSFDIKKFVLTISNKNGDREHLVLSGMTYPLSFGWLQVKLDKFGVDSELFTDAAPYNLTNYGFGPSKELSLPDEGAEEYAKYFSNAWEYLERFSRKFELKEPVRFRPKYMDVFVHLITKNHKVFKIGFSPGDENYIEPYCFVAMDKIDQVKNDTPEVPAAIWHNKEWTGFVLLISNIYHIEPEKEQSRVDDFIKESIRVLDSI